MSYENEKYSSIVFVKSDFVSEVAPATAFNLIFRQRSVFRPIVVASGLTHFMLHHACTDD